MAETILTLTTSRLYTRSLRGCYKRLKLLSNPTISHQDTRSLGGSTEFWTQDVAVQKSKLRNNVDEPYQRK